jgi:4-amino-4-deoxy-L-arabinose transferase-like glycosyltransferase
MTATALPETTAEPAARPTRLHRLVHGRQQDPQWARPALLGLLAATGLLYLWGLGASGWANDYYAAAVQAGSTSWKAFFFGSFDSANFITVDKPPASLWVMDISARIFGVNAWSVLVPQALEGVAAVGLLYATVRRRFSPAAGLLAGAVFALTPVATLMFRFNNPDALLTLLLVAAAYAVTRAVETGGTRWLLLAGTLVGFGFLTKMLQAMLVVPAFALAYLVAGPTPVRRRLLQLLAAGAALVVAAGWWVAIVELWPAGSRPYIGGSQHNSVLDLILGYNGLGRITGDETGSVGGAGPTGSRWGPAGWTRLFNADNGGQICWLIPAALILLGAALWLTRRAPRTDPARSALILWGGWLLVTAATFSLMQGIFHPYYSVVLAPAVGALVGIGGVSLWRLRQLPWVRVVLAGTVLVTAWWSYTLLGRSPGWFPLLRPVILIAALAGAVVLLVGAVLPRGAAALLAAAALLVALAGPAAYAVQTASSTHGGAIPSAGPRTVGLGGPGGFGRARFPGGGTGPGALPGGGTGPGGPPGGFPGGGVPGGFPGGFPGGGFPGGGAVPGAGTGQGNQPGQGSQAGQGGQLGGLLDAGAPSAEVAQRLSTDADSYAWVAAVVGANRAAGIQLAVGGPVLAIGGFNGTDPTPTLAQFQQFVAQGKIHYYIVSGGLGGGGFGAGTGTGAQIAAWVQRHYRASAIGGVVLYDLTVPV